MTAEPASPAIAYVGAPDVDADRAAGDVSIELDIEGPFDLVATLGPLYRGPRDPTMRLGSQSVARAARTPDGPGSVVIDVAAGGARVRAWGPGGNWLVTHALGFLGLDDDATGFDPALHNLVAGLARRRPGLRLGRTG